MTSVEQSTSTGRPAMLAPELLSAILATLDPSKPLSGVTLVRFGLACRAFHAVADDAQLWKTLYLSRWRRHRSRAAHLALLLDDSKATARADGGDPGKRAGAWRSRYGERHRRDRQAASSVDAIAQQPVGRYEHGRQILTVDRMDVFDSLLDYQASLASEHPAYTKLPERLWVGELLDALRRSETLGFWMDMVGSGGELSPLQAVGAFSGFRGCDRLELEETLDALSRRVLSAIGGTSYLDKRPDPREVALRVCEELNKFVAPAHGTREFLNIDNHFLNLTLRGVPKDQDVASGEVTPPVLPMRTLPMSLVCIFCSILDRLGLLSSVIAFPQRILCRISGWKGDGATPALHSNAETEEHIIDVFEGGRALSRDEINSRLADIGLPPSHAPHFLRPARASELVARVGRNIIQSLQRADGGISAGSNATSRSAHAAVAALLFLQPNNLIDALPNLLHQFPMDVYAIEHDYIPLVMREGLDGEGGAAMADRLRHIQRSMLEKDEAPIVPRLREQERKSEMGDDKPILHHIGTVFRHRKWGYIGVIKRWDPRCCADEIWIQSNSVDLLDNGGRAQPFYSISADDGSDRYIAQVNVVPLHSVTVHTINKIVSTHEDLGHSFTRALPEKGIFELEPGHRLKYPEDAKWQDEQLARA